MARLFTKNQAKTPKEPKLPSLIEISQSRENLTGDTWDDEHVYNEGIQKHINLLVMYVIKGNRLKVKHNPQPKKGMGPIILSDVYSSITPPSYPLGTEFYMKILTDDHEYQGEEYGFKIDKPNITFFKLMEIILKYFHKNLKDFSFRIISSDNEKYIQYVHSEPHIQWDEKISDNFLTKPKFDLDTRRWVFTTPLFLKEYISQYMIKESRRWGSRNDDSLDYSLQRKAFPRYNAKHDKQPEQRFTVSRDKALLNPDLEFNEIQRHWAVRPDENGYPVEVMLYPHDITEIIETMQVDYEDKYSLPYVCEFLFNEEEDLYISAFNVMLKKETKAISPGNIYLDPGTTNLVYNQTPGDIVVSKHIVTINIDRLEISNFKENPFPEEFNIVLGFLNVTTKLTIPTVDADSTLTYTFKLRMENVTDIYEPLTYGAKKDITTYVFKTCRLRFKNHRSTFVDPKDMVLYFNLVIV